MSTSTDHDLITISIPSPIGELRADARGDSLCGLYLPTSRWPAPPATVGAGDAKRGGVLAETARQLRAYFAGKLTAFDLPLAPDGTPFQRDVWRALVTIPFGETWSYGQLARSLGRPDASRAVGAANGKNPIAIIVPCHRVIGASGSLVGYGGGLPTKRWLLAHEADFGLRTSDFSQRHKAPQMKLL